MTLPIVLADDNRILDLLPLTFTRPVWDLRMGIFTQKERWEAMLGGQVFTFAPGVLAMGFNHLPLAHEALVVNSGVMPDEEMLRELSELSPNHFLTDPANGWIAARCPAELLKQQQGPLDPGFWEAHDMRPQASDRKRLWIRYPEHIFLHNGEMIARDFPLATRQGPSEPVTDPHTRVYGADNLYVAPGARIRAAILNAEEGPIYLGPQAQIGEGAILVRPHAICANGTVALGAKLRGDTTVGPYCKVGGEVSNSILMSYSNKGHDGYLGNAVIGSWCNLGADTNNSNLKNNYAEVKLWHEASGRFRSTGLQFCGLIMGDHSKCGINTMFNTGTVVGVSANIFGDGFPRQTIASFAWGGAAGFKTYALDKALEVAELVMQRRGISLSDADRAILTSVFEQTAGSRRA